MRLAAPIHLLGVPFNSGGSAGGVARAPGALRRAGLAEQLAAVAPGLIDLGDLELGPTTPERDPASHIIAPGALVTMIASVRAHVAASLESGAFPLVLGGDCPVLLGCLAAVGAQTGLLFVDGHEDAWPPVLSVTGEAADMELGLALSLSSGDLPDYLAREMPQTDPAGVVVLGARDRAELDESGVPSVDELVPVVGPEALAHPEDVIAACIGIVARNGAWWLHVDLDVLSTKSLGAVDYRLPGGIDWEQLTRLTRAALSAPGVVGCDVTTYNPDLDPGGRGARRIVRYLRESLSGDDGEARDDRH